MTENASLVVARMFRAAVVVYIAMIGVFAIEELQRREKLVAMMTARETEVTSAIAAITSSQADDAAALRAALEGERHQLHALRVRLTALIIGGTSGPKGAVKAILCGLAQTKNADMTCDEVHPEGWSARELSATLVLKRVSEQRSSGDIFAVLVIVAAIGGALIKLYLDDSKTEPPAFRPVLRAIGGGIVCYLVISGGTIPFNGTSVTSATTPATGALYGLLAGMFATKVFELVTALVENWVEKLKPAKH
jgi:hypothetical protein